MTGADANIILGITVDDNMDDEVSVTVIATGLGEPASTPTGAFRTNSGMVYNTQPRQSSADLLASMQRTAAPASQSGVTNTPPVVNRPVTPTPVATTPIQRPTAPTVPTESTVPELNIKMPDFMNSIKK
jgi:cell division protein FtsZ